MCRKGNVVLFHFTFVCRNTKIKYYCLNGHVILYNHTREGCDAKKKSSNMLRRKLSNFHPSDGEMHYKNVCS